MSNIHTASANIGQSSCFLLYPPNSTYSMNGSLSAWLCLDIRLDIQLKIHSQETSYILYQHVCTGCPPHLVCAPDCGSILSPNLCAWWQESTFFYFFNRVVLFTKHEQYVWETLEGPTTFLFCEIGS